MQSVEQGLQSGNHDLVTDRSIESKPGAYDKTPCPAAVSDAANIDRAGRCIKNGKKSFFRIGRKLKSPGKIVAGSKRYIAKLRLSKVNN